MVVNECTPLLRYNRQNRILSSIWYGKSPEMSIFFKPLIEEIKQINIQKLTYTSKTNETLKISVYPIFFCADTPARCKVLNFKQFNGRYGCTYCYNLGIGQKEFHNEIDNRARHVSTV